MGGLLSSFAASEAPPSVVLVPPLVDRERKGRSRRVEEGRFWRLGVGGRR